MGGRCRTATPRRVPRRLHKLAVTTPPGRVRRRTKWLVALAAVLLAAFAVVVLPADPGATPAFDPVVWRAQAGVETGSRRFGMIRDLETTKLRVGMTREEVHDLLGVPESFRPGYDGWGLGFPPFGMDYDSYAVRYGPDGRVTGFGRVQG